MAEHSTIEWTEATWNPITGCTIISPGCTHCYAMKLAGGRLRQHPSRKGLTIKTKNGPVWNGDVRFNSEWLDQPLRWKRPRMIFTCAHSDLFHEDVPDAWIDDAFAVMALSHRHTFQVLTKRDKRMRRYVAGLTAARVEASARKIGHTFVFEGRTLLSLPLANVWLGVSAERQQEVDARIPHLLSTPAAVRFVSLEPLIGPIDLTFVTSGPHASINALDRGTSGTIRAKIPSLDWVIVGGESGRHARPMHPSWARSLRDQCADAGVPFFFKQHGEWQPKTRADGWRLTKDHVVFEGSEPKFYRGWPPGGGTSAPPEFLERVGKKAAGRLLDGRTHDGMPGRAA